MFENLKSIKRKYRKEPVLHLVFLLMFGAILGLSHLNVGGFVLPIFLHKLLFLLISVSGMATAYYFLKKLKK